MADAPIPNAPPSGDPAPNPQAEQSKNPNSSDDRQSPRSLLAEWCLIGAAILGILTWAYIIPKHPKPIYQDRLLNDSVTEARDRVKANSADISARSQLEERIRDLAVWTRYEQELREFEWISDLNWDLYAGFKVLIIFGGVITPALIAKKDFGNKLAVLFSILTAVSGGFITEFDYKSEASRAEKAIALLETEKTLFITRSSKSYALACCPPDFSTETAPTGAAAKSKNKATGKSDQNEKHPATSNPQRKTPRPKTPDEKGLEEIDSDLHMGEPVPNPTCYEDARANFAYVIARIYENAVDDRLLFLDKKEGTPSGTTSSGSKPASR